MTRFHAEHGVSFSAVGGRVGAEVNDDGEPLSGRAPVWLVGALNADENLTVLTVERPEMTRRG